MQNEQEGLTAFHHYDKVLNRLGVVKKSDIFILRVSVRNFGVAGEEQSCSFVTSRQSRKRHRDTSRKYQLFLNDSLNQI